MYCHIAFSSANGKCASSPVCNILSTKIETVTSKSAKPVAPNVELPAINENSSICPQKDIRFLGAAEPPLPSKASGMPNNAVSKVE